MMLLNPLCVRVCVRAFLAHPFTNLEAIWAPMECGKVHNLPIFFRKPVGPFVLQIEARFSRGSRFVLYLEVAL